MLTLQTVDSGCVAGAFRLGESSLEVFAALAYAVVLDVEEQARDLTRLGRWLLYRHHGLRERTYLVVRKTGDEDTQIEPWVDALVVRGARDDDRAEQLASEGTRQLIGPELIGDAKLLVGEQQQESQQLGFDRCDGLEDVPDGEGVSDGAGGGVVVPAGDAVTRAPADGAS